MTGCGQREDCTMVSPHTHADGDTIYAPLWAAEMERIHREYIDAIAQAMLGSLENGIDDFLNDPKCELSPEDRATAVLASCFRCGRVTVFDEKIGTACSTEGCEGRYVRG